MPIFHNKKVIFVHVPKTGGTTIRKTINFDNCQNKCNITNFWGYPDLGYTDYSYDDVINLNIQISEIDNIIKKIFGVKRVCLQHISLTEIKKLHKAIHNEKYNIDEYLSLGILRNPVDRFFSAFLNRQYVNKKIKDKDVFNRDVNGFLNTLKKIKSPEIYDGKYCHYRSQVELLKGVDNIYLFENLNHKIPDICQTLSYNYQSFTKVKKENKNRNKDYKKWKEVIKLDTIKNIQKYYLEDLRLYEKIKKGKNENLT